MIRPFVTWAILTLGLGLSLAAAPDEPIAEVLLSRQLLERRGLAVGDLVHLSAGSLLEDARPFRIVGSYEPVADPMLLTAERLEARLHLPDLLDLIEDSDSAVVADSVTAINVELRNPDRVEEFARELTSRVPGLVVTPTGEGQRATTFVVIERFHVAISWIALVAAAAFLVALMIMRADERRETVGILRLLGFRKRRVLLEVFLEGSLIALAGAVFGVLIVALVQGGFNRFFQWYYDTPLVFLGLSLPLALRCIAMAVPLGVLAGLVASWHLLRRDVLTLIRR